MLGGIGLEHIPHQAKGQDVKKRTDRPKKQHKTAYVRWLPALWFFQHFLIDVIEWNGDLGHVVQQVLNQQVHRQHRQKRDERTGHQHREHIAEVRTGRHFDVLEHIGEGPAPFQHALLQHHQAFLQQDDVSRFLGDIHGTVHRDADICRTQRRGIVDAVAHKTHDMAIGLEQAHDTFLVRRRQSGKHVGGLHGHRQLAVAHALNVVAHQQTLLFKAHFTADLGRDQFVVTGQDLDRHPVLGQGFKRRRSALFGRVEERHITDQRQFLFIAQAVGLAPLGHGPRSHGHHAQALFVEGSGNLANTRQQFVTKGFFLLAMTHGLAHGQHFFHSALADQHMRLALFDHHHGHAPTGEVERDFIDLAEGRTHVQFAVDLDMLQHRHVQQVFQTGLVVAVEVSHFQNIVRLLPPYIHMPGQKNLVLGQGAGLVSAQHIHRPKVLDGIKTLDDDFFTRQKHCALGQGRRHDHRQHFRGQAHGNRQREQQGFSPVALGKAVDKQHQRGHHEHKADQQPTDLVDPGLE